MRRTATIALFALPLAACAAGPSDPAVSPMRARDAGAAHDSSTVADATPPDDVAVPDPMPTPAPTHRPPMANPPAISGGTMTLAYSNHTAVVADPDRDEVFVVDLLGQSVLQEIHLEAGDEPGRVITDDAGRAHVALRNGGAVVTIDLTTGAVLARRAVCPSPRGLAWVPLRHEIVVACQSGEIVGLPPAPDQPVSWSHRIDSDLRDVFVDGTTLFVTRFRVPEVLRINDANEIAERIHPTIGLDPMAPAQTPEVAWRARPLPGGGWVMSHQLGKNAPLDTLSSETVEQGGGYGGGGSFSCTPGAVEFGMTIAQATQSSTTGGCALNLPLPVDIAPSPDGMQLAVVSAVSPTTADAMNSFNASQGQVALFDRASGAASTPTFINMPVPAQLTSVEYIDATTIAVYSRQPAALFLVNIREPGRAPTMIPLSTVGRYDEGHSIFHSRTGAGMACASCHPEAGDDGRTWHFILATLSPEDRVTGAPRRTPTLYGHLMDTAPFHWDGDMHDFGMLTSEVFTHRMGGATLSSAQVNAMSHWLDTIGTPPALAVDATSAERGRTLFQDPSVGCASCHSGAKFTNNSSINVGTGGTFQVPSLIGVHTRSPWLHNGCAPTLVDRFTNTACGGGEQHGHTAHLTPDQIGDLVAYLQTL